MLIMLLCCLPNSIIICYIMMPNLLTMFWSVANLVFCPKNFNIFSSRSNKKRKNNHLRPDIPFYSNMLPTFRAIKGSKVNICQFTANKKMKFCQGKDRVLMPKRELPKFVLIYCCSSLPAQCFDIYTVMLIFSLI